MDLASFMGGHLLSSHFGYFGPTLFIPCALLPCRVHSCRAHSHNSCLLIPCLLPHTHRLHPTTGCTAHSAHDFSKPSRCLLPCRLRLPAGRTAAELALMTYSPHPLSTPHTGYILLQGAQLLDSQSWSSHTLSFPIPCDLPCRLHPSTGCTASGRWIRAAARDPQPRHHRRCGAAGAGRRPRLAHHPQRRTACSAGGCASGGGRGCG